MLQDERSKAEQLVGLLGIDGYMQQELANNPPPAIKQAPQQAPMSLMDQMDERKGKFKNRLGLFGHIMGGGKESTYGDADLLAQQKQMQMQKELEGKMGMAQPYIDMLQDGNQETNMAGMYGLSQMGFNKDMMEMAMPGYSSSSELPDATRSVIHYQDALNRYVDEETGEVRVRQMGEDGYVKFNEAFDQYKNREIGGLREQAAAKAGGAEEGKLDANEVAKNESQKPQMEVAYDLVSSILDDPNNTYHNAYGVIDAMTPTVRQETADVESKIKQIGDILYMFARGELKGQGQVTEQEAESARNAASRITNMRMSESEAEDELRRLQKMFGQRIGSSGQGGQASGPPSYSQFEEDARARGITDPVMISTKYKELYGG